MRAITVRQPWAWAIVHGGKDVENRSRNIAGSYRGPVAIHAGLAFDNQAADTSPFVQAWHEVWPTKHPATCDPRIVPQGAIIGVVDLVDAHPASHVDSHTSPDGVTVNRSCCQPWGMLNHHHLVLKNPRALKNPIPAKGKLGLWKPGQELIEAINKELENT